MSFEKIYLGTQIANTIHSKNNTAQLYFILGRVQLHFIFSSIPVEGSDIHRFSNTKWVLTMCTVGNLSLSGTFLSKPLADPGGDGDTRPPLPGPNFFHSHAVFGKNLVR